MTTYHKIQSIFKRDMEKPGHPLIIGEYSEPEFEYLKDCQWEFEEKIDGMNTRVLLTTRQDGDDTINTLEFKGRTDKARMPKPLIDRLTKLFPIEKLLDMFPIGNEGGERNVVLYGEGYGGKIQKGKKYSETEDFILFDVRIGR